MFNYGLLTSPPPPLMYRRLPRCQTSVLERTYISNILFLVTPGVYGGSEGASPFPSWQCPVSEFCVIGSACTHRSIRHFLSSPPATQTHINRTEGTEGWERVVVRGAVHVSLAPLLPSVSAAQQPGCNKSCSIQTRPPRESNRDRLSIGQHRPDFPDIP